MSTELFAATAAATATPQPCSRLLPRILQTKMITESRHQRSASCSARSLLVLTQNFSANVAVDANSYANKHPCQSRSRCRIDAMFVNQGSGAGSGNCIETAMPSSRRSTKPYSCEQLGFERRPLSPTLLSPMTRTVYFWVYSVMGRKSHEKRTERNIDHEAKHCIETLLRARQPVQPW